MKLKKQEIEKQALKMKKGEFRCQYAFHASSQREELSKFEVNWN